MTHYQKTTDPTCYRAGDPNCYTYVDGYGFTPPPPIVTERRMLQRYSNGLGFATLLYFLLATVLPFLLLWGVSFFRPAIRIYGNQVMASGSVIQLVNLLSSAICLFLPFFLFILLSHIPMRVAFPLKKFSASLCVPCVFLALAVSVIGVTSSSLIGGLLSFAGLQPHTSLYLPQTTAARVLFGICISRHDFSVDAPLRRQLCIDYLRYLICAVPRKSGSGSQRFSDGTGHWLLCLVLRFPLGWSDYPRGQQYT